MRQTSARNNKATTGVVAWKSARQGATLGTIPLNEFVERGVAAKEASSGSAWRGED
jgi:hypothetical protein